MYNKDIKMGQGLANGYFYFIDKDHPLSSKNGMVYYHRHVASIHIGRWISSEECVHHKDEDKTNNVISNLEVMTAEQHARMHLSGTLDPVPLIKVCSFCKKEFVAIRNSTIFCSRACVCESSRRFTLSKEELSQLVWELPLVHISKMYKVSTFAMYNKDIKIWA
jgi:hypothetical protein